MVEIHTTGDKLKEIFTISGICNGDIFFDFGVDTIKSFSKDPSNSSMILAEFKKEFFDGYKSEGGTYGFARDAFTVVNKRMKKNNASLIISEYGMRLTENKTTWDISILGDTDPRIRTPVFETGILFSIPIADFQESIIRAKDGGSLITFEMTKDQIKMGGGEYQNKNKIYTLFDKSSFINYVFEPICGGDKVIATYGGDFFDSIRMFPSDSILEVRLDAGLPIKVISHDENSNYIYTYMVAPIIDNED